jgi:hypothetical protein
MNQIINQLEKKMLIIQKEADLMHNNFDGIKLQSVSKVLGQMPQNL